MITKTTAREVRPIATSGRVTKPRLAALAGLVVLLVLVAVVWAANIQQETPMAASDRAIDNALRQIPASDLTVEYGRHHDYGLRHIDG